MRTSHALLLRLLHDPQYEFGKVSVEYVDRGAPGDVSRVQGDRIIRLEQGFMEIESEMKTKFIPMHRIRRIAYDGETMWEKGIEPSAKKISNEDLDRDLDRAQLAVGPLDFALVAVQVILYGLNNDI